MPGSQVIRVIALGPVASCCTEIIEVTSGASNMIVMITRNGSGAAFMPSPGRRVAMLEVSRGPIAVGVVSEGENSARNIVE